MRSHSDRFRLGIANIVAVSLNASGLASVIHVPADRPTIQDAIDNASAGDEIVVAPGIWDGFDVEYDPADLTIRSTDPNDVEVVATTVIATDSLLFSVDATISGLTFANIARAALVIGTNNTVTVSNCSFVDNAAPTNFGPGAIGGSECDLTIVACSFIRNSGTDRGGAINLGSSAAEIVGCTFIDNDARFEGGAIWAFGSAVVVDDCSFHGNTALDGGAMYGGYLTVRHSVLSDNRADRGGAIYSNSSLSSVAISNTTIRANTAPIAGGGVFGDVTATGGLSTICGNIPDQISGTATGVLYVNDECPPPVTLVTELVDPVAEGWSADSYDASAFDTHRVYAVFDEPVAVVGVGDVFDDGIPFEVLVSNGQFHNDAMGSDVPPNSALATSFPSMKWDTFVTIGEPTGLGGGGAATTELSPDFTTQANGLDGDFTLDGTGWYVLGYPSHADAVFDVATGTYRVLIAQFTVEQRERVTGTNWRISANLGGQGGTSVDVFGDFLTRDPCPADFNGNNAVKFEDLTEVLGHWGACVACTSDIDGDGVVGFSDLTALLTAWGACP